jgi:hypothetical protein
MYVDENWGTGRGRGPGCQPSRYTSACRMAGVAAHPYILAALLHSASAADGSIRVAAPGPEPGAARTPHPRQQGAAAGGALGLRIGAGPGDAKTALPRRRPCDSGMATARQPMMRAPTPTNPQAVSHDHTRDHAGAGAERHTNSEPRRCLRSGHPHREITPYRPMAAREVRRSQCERALRQIAARRRSPPYPRRSCPPWYGHGPAATSGSRDQMARSIAWQRIPSA